MNNKKDPIFPLNEEAIAFASFAWDSGTRGARIIIQDALDKGILKSPMPRNQFTAFVANFLKEEELISSLSEEAITQAMKIWKVPHSQAWENILKSIQSNQIQGRIPLSTFQTYLQTNVPKPVVSKTTIEPYRISPPSLSQTFKNILDNIAWQWVVILFIIFSCLLNFFSSSSSTSPKPTPAPPTLTNIQLTQFQKGVERLECEEDAINNVPPEYSRCYESTSPDLFLDDPIDPFVECLIKGNISFETGEKIYHVPGQEFYDVTTIDPSYGERWFCTEAEARAAGWRKSEQ